MIDTRSIHEQLLEQCQQELASGKWLTGDRFPSERELSAQHGISRATANKVLARLISEGWLEHQRGIGCFVAERSTLFTSLQNLESFTAFAEKLGLPCSTKVLTLKTQKQGEPNIRKSLGLSNGDPLWYLERLRCLDGQAVIYERRWLPASLFPGLTRKKLQGSFYRLCREQYQLNVSSETLQIQTTSPDHSLLSDWSSPAFVFRGVAGTAEDQPVWHQEISYRGDAFELRSVTGPSLPYPEFGLVFRGFHSKPTIK